MFKINIHTTFFVLFAFCLTSCKKDKSVSISPDNNYFKIAVGSCYNTALNDNSMWQEIVNNEPDIWFWLGDIVYADTHDMTYLSAVYDSLKNDTEYQKLLKSTEVIGIWDDHDYGQNDGGKYYSKKSESKNILLDFLDEDSLSNRYMHDGIYTSYIYGTGEKKVKLILLDTRYFRDTLQVDNQSDERYKPNPTGDILGEDQWAWLEAELSKNEAAIHILASGYQIIAWEPKYEKWSIFPTARKRLFDLIVKTKPNRAILLSGDRHISEVSKLDLEGLEYPLYEFTASGITHTWSENLPEENRHRVSELIIQKNFGLIEIDWSSNSPKITFEVRGKKDTLFTTFTPKL